MDASLPSELKNITFHATSLERLLPANDRAVSSSTEGGSGLTKSGFLSVISACAEETMGCMFHPFVVMVACGAVSQEDLEVYQNRVQQMLNVRDFRLPKRLLQVVCGLQMFVS